MEFKWSSRDGVDVRQMRSNWSGCGLDVEWMWSKWSPSGVQAGVWGSVKYRLKGKNVVFEARINKAWRGLKLWLGFDGTHLNAGPRGS